MLERLHQKLQNDDVAVSAVIGTILMIAATVILGGVIYAAVGGFGSKDITASSTTSAVFSAKAIDSDGNGATDLLKLTYVSGPSGVNTTAVITTISGNTPVAIKTAPDGVCYFLNPGDSCVYAKDTSGTALVGTYEVTIALAKTTALDQTVKVG
jgi:hypothetical protein